MTTTAQPHSVPSRSIAHPTVARWVAFSAHAYTIVGGVLALAALRAAAEHQIDDAFRLLFLTYLIDGTDGWLARRLAVRKHWPTIDGERLDALIDFTTMVVVPAFVTLRTSIVPRPELLWATVMVVASLVRFARVNTKANGCFTHLPSCWNVVVFYGVYLAPPPALVAVVITVVACAMLVPGRFPHPLHHASRLWHVAAATLALSIVAAVLVHMVPARPWLVVSLFYPIMYLMHTVALTTGIQSWLSAYVRRLASVIIGNYQRARYAL